MKNLIATSETVSVRFKTDYLTTNRILSNTCWGFFLTHFGEDAQKMWDEAHPFLYPAHPSTDYHSFSLDFIAKHFELFATNQFTTWSGWGDDANGKFGFQYKSWYRIEEVAYTDAPNKIQNSIDALLFNRATD